MELKLTEAPVIYDPVVILKPEMIKIGSGSRIDAFCKLEGGEGIFIGQGVHIASMAHLNIGGGKLTIGDFACVSAGGKIITGTNDIDALSCSAVAPKNMMRITRGKVRLSRWSIVFCNAIVLPGVTLGEGAVLGAGSVATEDIPPWEVWAGNPARRLRSRTIVHGRQFLPFPNQVP